ncbi:leucine-rich repeat domain-containing protein [Listeria costaricensis]|uniref:leucine-rich repeat domain-containing protein n=1 Tax=Listeria costaricensis TaxID=2026604 RepID=UPI0013C4F857|nr:leucine-rich repeat domain-containing protein [Listeria costaricensis]
MKMFKMLLCFAIGVLVIAMPLMVHAAGKKGAEEKRVFQQWFPDECLAKAVADEMGKNLTDQVSREELSRVTKLDCFDLGIQDMSGLKYLRGLEHLNITFNSVSDMDLTQCKKLKRLECAENKLTRLDLNQCKKLEEVFCNNNQLAKLNIKQCKELKELHCYRNNLAKLKLNNYKKLKCLNCNDNELEKLELSGCRKLDHLRCNSNKLTKLVLNKCHDLTSVSCFGNKLIKLDVSDSDDLFELDCHANQLTTVNLPKNPNRIDHLDVSHNAIQDFSFIPEEVIDFKGGKQDITVDLGKRVNQAGELTISVSPNLKDVFGNSGTMKILPDDGGIYDASTNTIAWTNLGDKGNVSYSFRGISSDGDFILPEEDDTDDILLGHDYWKHFADPNEVRDYSIIRSGGKITLHYQK